MAYTPSCYSKSALFVRIEEVKYAGLEILVMSVVEVCFNMGRKYAVTIFFHGSNMEFRDKTLAPIIRQSGFSKEEFYKALKK